MNSFYVVTASNVYLKHDAVHAQGLWPPFLGLYTLLVRNDFLWNPSNCVWAVTVVLLCLQELNNRLAAEITRLRTLLTGDGGGESTVLPLTQGKDAYELEVL